MKRFFHFLSQCYADTPPANRRATLACILVLLLMAAALAVQSCATSPQGLAREQAIYSAATNTVGTLQTIVPYVPAPVQVPTELILAAVSAALGAWNLHQQKAIKALKNGNGNGKPTSPTHPPPAPAA